jgi:hypothetical protein
MLRIAERARDDTGLSRIQKPNDLHTHAWHTPF